MSLKKYFFKAEYKSELYKFNYKNKIAEFKYIDITDLVNNTRDNTIGEISAKKGLNTLNKIKNAGIIKYKKAHP